MARSGKASIFTSEKIYNEIYRREHDYNVLYELVRIANKYDEFKKDYTKSNNDVEEIAVCSNGKFIVLAIVFYLYKRFKGIVEDYTDENLSKYNIMNVDLTMNYKEDDYDERLRDLFKFIVRQLKIYYSTKKNDLKLTSYSNFFKTDKTYQDIILFEIDRSLRDSYDREKLQEYMKIFDV